MDHALLDCVTIQKDNHLQNYLVITLKTTVTKLMYGLFIYFIYDQLLTKAFSVLPKIQNNYDVQWLLWD